MVNGNMDENYTVVGMGVASTTVEVDGVQYIAGVTPVPITVDTETQRLRCVVAGTSSAVPTPKATAQIDDNLTRTMGGEASDGSGTFIPLTIADNGGIMTEA